MDADHPRLASNYLTKCRIKSSTIICGRGMVARRPVGVRGSRRSFTTNFLSGKPFVDELGACGRWKKVPLSVPMHHLTGRQSDFSRFSEGCGPGAHVLSRSINWKGQETCPHAGTEWVVMRWRIVPPRRKGNNQFAQRGGTPSRSRKERRGVRGFGL